MPASTDPRLEALFEEWGALDRPDASHLADFARQFFGRPGARLFQTHDADSLRRTVEVAYRLASHRVAGDRLADVLQPEELPGRSVVAILQDDRPFLVDTIRLLLRRHGLREQWFLHPTLTVTRSDDGRLERFVGGDAESIPQSQRESLIYIEVFPRLEGEAAAAFIEDLDFVMGRLACVTDDHKRMIRAVRDVEANVEFAGHVTDVAVGRSEKICRFLDWLIDDHFVLLGVRRYDISGTSNAWHVRLRDGAELGIWRAGDEPTTTQTLDDDLPQRLPEALDDPRIIQISKGGIESRIHRAGRIDRVLVKEHDDRGEVCGVCVVSGLFTFAALRTPSSKLPLLAERLEQILEEDGAPAGSHRNKALIAAFDSAPMEFLLDASVQDNATLISEIVEAEGSDEPRVLVRTDSRGRSFYAAVIMPRERYGEILRASIRRLLEQNTSVGFVDDRVSFLEEGTALLHYFCTMKSGSTPDVSSLEREVRRLAANWDDRLTDALIERRGAAEGGELAARYVDAFAEGLRVTTHPADAVRDIEGLEALFATGESQIALRLDRMRPQAPDQMLRLYLQEERLLSDLLPIVDHLGIRVVDARQVSVNALDRPPAHLHALRIEPLGADAAELSAIEGRLGDALRVVLAGTMQSDALNELVLRAGLDWRQVDLIRSYVEYHNQVQASLTRRFVIDVLLQNPEAAELLVRYHEARLAPGMSAEERQALDASLTTDFLAYRDRVHNLNEDRALASLFELVEATLRTNFFARPAGSHRIATKIDPSRIGVIRPPHAYREVFVHGPSMNGIHIRGGPVARGGLRWSDRIDDFRTEVLGLMRTQQLKNGLIVPVGAKGGFVLRKPNTDPRIARTEADEKYAVFVEALLDITDDVDPDGTVRAPEGVHRRDGDDPYLVVAADKGTAHLSDTANAIAVNRGFWLGDAFASGGSVGYDHKKYAITAGGAWACVRHHFDELGLDPETQPYTVAGIGDMSGDVFGNGLLLMRKAKLVAAFDHRHIFLDPDPDPEIAWQERKRLFDLPGSSWADYDVNRLSSGGSVHPRSAKNIEISDGVRGALGITETRLTGPDLVRAILAAPVDLLWNGGIGTYVKASGESHQDVGDRANESVRIDASALRARVIGEGGNLGLSQTARVEAALVGVRLDTDAIHNSAGVDLSDHEVNYKILIAPFVRDGSLSDEDRADRLFGVAEEACASVLAHNRSQALAISLDEARSSRDPEPFRVAIDLLCEAQGVVADEVGLPSEATLRLRKSEGEGLVRPELAVLLGLAKLDLRLALVDSDFVDAEELAPLHAAYYPRALRERFGEALPLHRLRREIVALEATNRIIDSGGITAITSLVAKRGISVPAAASAWIAADSILDAASFRAALRDLKREVGFDAVRDALIEIDAAVEQVARYFAAEGLGLQGATRTAAWRAGLFELSADLGGFLSKAETMRHRDRTSRFGSLGFPDDLAAILAGASLADRGLNIVRLAEDVGQPVSALAPAYARLGDRSQINWIYQNLPHAHAEDAWDRVVLMDLRTEMLSLQRDMTAQAIARRPDEPIAAVDDFLREQSAVIDRAKALLSETVSNPTASSLTVVAQSLMRLRAAQA